MAVIRDDLRAALWRGREGLAALALAAFGVWLIVLGGYVLVPIGLALLALAAVWARLALRRLRFDQGIDAPGVVEVDEAQVGYLGPTEGGYVALPDLVELRLVTIAGRRLWRLKQADGQALLIPVQAAGAERLFDAFSALPGMDSEALVAALEAGGGAAGGAAGGRAVARAPGDSLGLVIWKRAARVALR